MSAEGAASQPEELLVLPFAPAEIPNRVGLESAVVTSMRTEEPGLDPETVRERANRVVASLAFLVGANESGFVHTVDAYLRCGAYGLRVILIKESGTLDY
jgi:hypothetical protein